MMRWISRALMALLVLCCAAVSLAQPGSTPPSTVNLFADQIDDLGQSVEQDTTQAELNLAQSQGAPDLLGEMDKLLEAIEKATQAQENAETMEGILGQMTLAGLIDVGANVLTQAQVDAIKAAAEDKVDKAKDDAVKAKRVAEQAKERLIGIYPSGLFGVRWTWPWFPFFLLLLLNTGLVIMVWRRTASK